MSVGVDRALGLLESQAKIQQKPRRIGMTIRRLFQILYGTLLALVLGLATIAVLLFINQRTLGRSQQIRFESHFLAEQLRRSGDDLTRFAQTYVVTGEPRYEQYYWETLAIRNGQRPLPEHYDERNHWDFEK
jgi:methyl-accepting chemotaxis protein